MKFFYAFLEEFDHFYDESKVTGMEISVHLYFFFFDGFPQRVKVELPDQESLSLNNATVSLGFTSYENLGHLMSASSTGGNIRLI